MSKKGAETTGSLSFPGYEDITQRLHFDPAGGHIWLDNERMVLVHTEAISAFREELCAVVGEETARSLITRMGYIAGCRDAEFAKRTRPEGSHYEAFSVGPQLHALKGMAEIEMLDFHMDLARGELHGEFLFKDSFEDTAGNNGQAASGSGNCWMLAGYASGFATTFMGRHVVVREIECRCQGHPQCRAQARLAEHWPDADRLLRYLYPPAEQTRAANSEQTDAATPLARLPEPGHPQAGRAVGASTAFAAILHQVNRVAKTRATVLLLGESGVGKSLIAREVHDRSGRAEQPFVAVNCAALPDTLMEAELFGVEKGAYTGAATSRPGRFELAEGGTLFLDEIATLSLTAQGKLLRVLQNGEFERLGSTQTRRADVRVIAATNADLRAEIGARRFREDLYYRLNVFPLTMPPLRARRDDIPPLIGYFLDRFARLHERQVPGLSPDALAALLAYAWPGNVRELENVIERAVILAEDNLPLQRSQLFLGEQSPATNELMHLGRDGGLSADADGSPQNKYSMVNGLIESLVGSDLDLPMLWDQLLLEMLERCEGNVTSAAKSLGITRAQMDYRLKKLRS